MIPLNLRISGFLSYRDPVEIDFSTFDLACISGQNGAGKSSLLDAITWALFGQARRRDDALINAHSTAAEVRLDFSYENNVYRVQRSKPRDKSTLLEFFIRLGDGNGNENGGDWKPLTERSVRETEARLEQTLRMDYETFINASFFLQGKADQFAQQRPSDRKRILSSILGLEVWENFREKTADQRKQLETEYASIDGRLHEITAELGEEPARLNRLKELETALEGLALTRAAQEATVESLRQLAASLARQQALVEELDLQWRASQKGLEVVEARLAGRQAECRTLAAELSQAAEIETAYQAWLETREALARWEETAARFREQEKARSAPYLEIEKARHSLEVELQGLRETGRIVQAGANETLVLRGQAETLEQAVQLTRQMLDKRASLDGDLKNLQQNQADAKAENPRLKSEMDELKERIDRLQEAEGALCPLCGQPLSPQDREKLIGSLNQQGKTLGERFRQNRALLAEFEARWKALESEIAGLANAEIELRAHERQIDQIHSRIQALADQETDWQARGAPREQETNRLLEEKAYAPQAMAELARIDAELFSLGYDAAEHDAVRRKELAGRTLEADLRKLENARAALGPLEREIGDLEKQAGELRAQTTRQQAAFDQAAAEFAAASVQAPDLHTMESLLYQQREQENRLRMEVGAARQKVLVLDDLRTRQKELTYRREELSLQISRHKTLERAFSKDGVPALLIEQALPEIETQTNELLERLSGGAMSVSFQTQREYKDKARPDLKETLDILISDGAGTRDYELFSGGEAFRVNFAIRLALSRVLAQRAGARLQTLVIDEGFGSQDAMGRQKLIEAINLVKTDFAKVLVITHLEELKEYFPNRIEVEKTPTGSAVRVV